MSSLVPHVLLGLIGATGRKTIDLPPTRRGYLCLAPGGVTGRQDLGWEGWNQIFSATLNRADRARGLAATSASEGRTGRRVTMRRVARWPQVQTGCWGGQMQSFDSTRKNDFTKRSSNEWKLIVAIRPPGLRIPRAALSPTSISPSSSLTAMRMP